MRRDLQRLILWDETIQSALHFEIKATIGFFFPQIYCCYGFSVRRTAFQQGCEALGVQSASLTDFTDFFFLSLSHCCGESSVIL